MKMKKSKVVKEYNEVKESKVVLNSPHVVFGTTMQCWLFLVRQRCHDFHLRADHDASESSLFGQSQNLNKL